MNVYVLFASSPLRGSRKFLKVFSDTEKGLQWLRDTQKREGGELNENGLLLNIKDMNPPSTHVGISYDTTYWLEVHEVH